MPFIDVPTWSSGSYQGKIFQLPKALLICMKMLLLACCIEHQTSDSGRKKGNCRILPSILLLRYHAEYLVTYNEDKKYVHSHTPNWNIFMTTIVKRVNVDKNSYSSPINNTFEEKNKENMSF